MEWSQLTIGIIGALASITAAIFAYPVWRDYRRKAVLRLNVHNVEDASAIPLAADGVDNWQIVCGLALYNDGDREARNWRVRLLMRQPGIGIGLGIPSPVVVRDPYLVGGKWVNEVLAGNSADTVTRDTPVILGRRNAFNFSGNPQIIDVEYYIDADKMKTVKGLLRFQIDWRSRIARFVPE